MRWWFVLIVALACKPRPPASPRCIQDVELQFQRVDAYHARLAKGERPPAATYWSRYYLETARFVLTGKDGVDGAGATCTPADRDSADAARLREAFAERERKVRAIEQQRGVKFEGVLRTGPAWSWLTSKDGRLIDLQTAGTL